MIWRDVVPETNTDGEPEFAGAVDLTNDKGDLLAAVVWFDNEGPFYAHAMDPEHPERLKRIGPCTTLEGAKLECLKLMGVE